MMFRHAVLSDCGRYRYRLTRRWSGQPPVTFVMLNPSTADAEVDDPTIRRCIGFAQRWGFGALHVVNLFPWRATKPTDLVTARRDGYDITQRSERNIHIELCFDDSPAPPVAAWGAHKLACDEVEHVSWLATSWTHLGLTKAGAPRHPLYLPKATDPTPWSINDGR